jgi:hypothetical protein
MNLLSSNNFNNQNDLTIFEFSRFLDQSPQLIDIK